MSQQYTITAPVTLNGKPAGPENFDNFLMFEEGDIVELVTDPEDTWFWETEKPVVLVRRVADGPASIAQELDETSLVAI